MPKIVASAHITHIRRAVTNEFEVESLNNQIDWEQCTLQLTPDDPPSDDCRITWTPNPNKLYTGRFNMTPWSNRFDYDNMTAVLFSLSGFQTQPTVLYPPTPAGAQYYLADSSANAPPTLPFTFTSSPQCTLLKSNNTLLGPDLDTGIVIADTENLSPTFESWNSSKELASFGTTSKWTGTGNTRRFAVDVSWSHEIEYIEMYSTGPGPIPTNKVLMNSIFKYSGPDRTEAEWKADEFWSGNCTLDSATHTLTHQKWDNGLNIFVTTATYALPQFDDHPSVIAVERS